MSKIDTLDLKKILIKGKTSSINLNGEQTPTVISWDYLIINKLSKHIYNNIDNHGLLGTLDKDALSLLDDRGRNIFFALMKNLHFNNYRAIKIEEIKAREATINYLLDNDLVSSWNTPDDNDCSLIFAIDASAVKYLSSSTLLKIINKFGVNHRREKTGATAISHLHSLHHESVFNLFLKAGADTNLITHKGNTIAHLHIIRIISFINALEQSPEQIRVVGKILNQTTQLLEKNIFSIYKNMVYLKNEDGFTFCYWLDKAIELAQNVPNIEQTKNALIAIKEKISLQELLNAPNTNMQLSQGGSISKI